jgi:hypothetical protein
MFNLRPNKVGHIEGGTAATVTLLDRDIVVGTSSVERNRSDCSGTLSSMASNALKALPRHLA